MLRRHDDADAYYAACFSIRHYFRHAADARCRCFADIYAMLAATLMLPLRCRHYCHIILLPMMPLRHSADTLR